MFICGEFSSRERIRNLKGLVFDMDGVIFDSRGANRTYYNLILEGLGLGPMNKEQEDYVHAHAVRESLDYIVPDQMRDKLPEVRESVDYRRVLPSMILEPGLFDLLDAVRAAGLKRAIFTNRTNSLEMVVEHFGLRPYFDFFLCAADVRPKPHPEGMYRILDRWRMEPEHIAYIGDSHLDASAAVDAGVPFWAYKQELPGAEMLVQDFFTLRTCFLREHRPCMP